MTIELSPSTVADIDTELGSARELLEGCAASVPPTPDAGAATARVSSVLAWAVRNTVELTAGLTQAADRVRAVADDLRAADLAAQRRFTPDWF